MLSNIHTCHVTNTAFYFSRVILLSEICGFAQLTLQFDRKSKVVASLMENMSHASKTQIHSLPSKEIDVIQCKL